MLWFINCNAFKQYYMLTEVINIHYLTAKYMHCIQNLYGLIVVINLHLIIQRVLIQHLIGDIYVLNDVSNFDFHTKDACDCINSIDIFCGSDSYDIMSSYLSSKCINLGLNDCGYIHIDIK